MNAYNPKAKVFIPIIESQYANANDGTATAVLLACEIFKRVHPFAEKNGSDMVYEIVEEAIKVCGDKINELGESIKSSKSLQKCVANKLHQEKDFFSEKIVKAIGKTQFIPNDVGIISMSYGSLIESQLVPGLAFRKKLSHDGLKLEQNQDYKMAFIESKLEAASEEYSKCFSQIRKA